MQQTQLIPGDRRKGKTTSLLDDIVNTIIAMREGWEQKGQIAVVCHDHGAQKAFDRLLRERFAEREIEMRKSEVIEVFNPKSAERGAEGRRFKHVFLDNVDLFPDGIYSEELRYLWLNAATVVATYTPDPLPTIILLDLLDRDEAQRMARKKVRQALWEQQVKDWVMIQHMRAYIAGDV